MIDPIELLNRLYKREKEGYYKEWWNIRNGTGSKRKEYSSDKRKIW